MEAYNRIVLSTLKIISIVVSVLVIQGQLFPFNREIDFSFSPFLHSLLLSLLSVSLVIYCFNILPKHLESWIPESSDSLEEWIEKASQPSLKVAVILMAGLTLFIELVLIRWQTGLFPVFSLYKNFILLACFCGIGIGYALSRKPPLLLSASLPLLAISLALMMALRYGPDDHVLNLLHVPRIGSDIPGVPSYYERSFIANIGFYFPTFMLLSGSFLLNVLVLLPVAQFCGRLMEQIKEPLVSYGYNLLGSIGGVVVLFVLSWFWTGPVIWFGISVALLLWYQLVSSNVRQIGLVFAIISIVIIAWPVEHMVQDIYSPYQLIQKTTKKDGRTWFLGSGYYHQMAVDLSPKNKNRGRFKRAIGLGELAYRHASSLERVLIIGSGIGNDSAAALRAGAKIIDAVEIDPAIIEIGKSDHPEHPYQNPRVNPIVDDGRGFVRNTTNKYDIITYGMQDTTMLLSHGSNVRFDTFVFTQEGIEDAYKILNMGGTLSMLFMLKNDTLVGAKIYQILKDLPDANPVVVKFKNRKVINISYVNFLARKGEKIELSPSYLKEFSLIDATDLYEKDANDRTRILDLPTDDWPFFLMEKKGYPLYYVVSLCLILLLSVYVVRQMLPGQQLRVSLLPFFFLGAGFMLVETKAITELALVFGNTWQVIAITIISVLIMAFFANLFVARVKRQFVTQAFVFLLLVVIAGYLVAINGGIASSGVMAKLGAIILLTSPMFFSGIVFSSLFKNAEDITGALAYNIMGAMLGGLLEYNSLRFGFSFLYLIALTSYGLAWLTTLQLKRHSDL